MRSSLALAAIGTAVVAIVVAGPSVAQSPQAYPYCALGSSSGATSCYYSSRAQCGSTCIPNPSYRSQEGAMAAAGSRRYRIR